MAAPNVQLPGITAGQRPGTEGNQSMELSSENTEEQSERRAANAPESISGQAIYTYNLDDSTTPGGIKVRWKARIVTGARARRCDARQAEAIRELLQLAHHHSPDRT